jgi:hypothetical protein
VAWMDGSLPDTQEAWRQGQACTMHPAMQLVSPDGSLMQGQALAARLRGLHGCLAEGEATGCGRGGGCSASPPVVCRCGRRRQAPSGSHTLRCLDRPHTGPPQRIWHEAYAEQHLEGSCWLVTYVECHERQGSQTRRQATAVVQHQPGAGQHDHVWRAVHETALPPPPS